MTNQDWYNIFYLFQTANHHIGSGGGTLEVLYEDPKEDLQSDVLSILSCGEINDDDKKKLIEEISGGSHADGSNLKPSINGRLNKRNIFSRFASSSTNSNEPNGDAPNSDAKIEIRAQKTEEELILESSWLKLDEEIRDVNLLIDEYYHSVSISHTIGVAKNCWLENAILLLRTSIENSRNFLI